MSSEIKVLVTGASGQLGGLLIHNLLDRGVAAHQITAGARNAQKLAAFEELGINVTHIDYDQPDLLSKAFAQVDAVVLVSGSEIGKRVAQHQNVIDAAAANNIKKLIYTSVTEADTTTNPVAPEHKLTEEAIKSSGVPFIIARNNWYTENYLSNLDTARQTGTLSASVGTGKVASATRTDFAEALAVLVLDDQYIGQTLELGGDHAWDYQELASAISEVIGQDVAYKDLSTQEHQDVLNAIGLDESTAGFVLALDEAISHGALAFTDGTLSQLIGRPTTPLPEGLREA